MVINNFKIIGLTLLTITVLGVIVSVLFLKIIEPICDWVGTYFARRMKSKLWLYILEILFFATTGSFIYINVLAPIIDQPSELLMVFFFIYILLILIESSAYREYRKMNKTPMTAGITGWLINRTIWKSYFANRIFLFINQLMHTFYLFIPVYISLIFFSVLNWEESHYFYSLLLVPVYSNLWVYLKLNWKKYFFKVSFNSYEEIFMRRLVIYLLIIVYALFDINKRFGEYLYKPKELSFEYLFIYAAVVLYIALDRLFKEIVSDVEKFKKDKTSKQLGTASPNNVFTHRGTSPLGRLKIKQGSKFKRHIHSPNRIAAGRDRASRTIRAARVNRRREHGNVYAKPV